MKRFTVSQKKIGYIFKIVCNKTSDFYIGSTTRKIKTIFIAHKSNAKLNKSNRLYDHMRENGIENFRIEVIEEFEITSKDEIGKKEKEYYMKLKPTLNMITPSISSIASVGRVYRLFDKLNTSQFYIGSTKNDLQLRLMQHQSFSTKGTSPVYRYIKEKGRDNFDIEVIEDNIDCDSLIVREDYWINELKPPLNTNLFLTRTEKERDKVKYEKNKEQIKKRVNERRLLKKEEINAQKRKHYAKNKEAILAKQKTQEYKDNANAVRRKRRARKKLESIS